MIRKAYIILAHKNPAQVRRLIGALRDGSSSFFVHIDGRKDSAPFRKLLEGEERVSFLPQTATEWGSFGLVDAVLDGLKAAMGNDPADHVILLSGQDYPLQSNDRINEFLRRNEGQVFLEHFELPCPAKWQPNGGWYRVNKYFRGLKPHQRYTAKAMNFAALLLPFLRRRIYGGMKAYAGSMWWIMNREAAGYILDFVDRHPGYVRFHRHTFAPDELFFHMILLNAKKEDISVSVVNDDKRYIRWNDIRSAHPEIIRRHDLDELFRSDALFARKFDPAADPEVLDLIDAERTTL